MEIIMPGHDRTGPTGMGTMSGKGYGFCSGNQMSKFQNGRFRCGNRGYSSNRYRQRGIHSVFRTDDLNSIEDSSATSVKPANPEQELEFLEEQKKTFESQLKETEKKIDHLRSS